MLHITVLAVGKIKEPYLREGIKEYEKRLRPYTKLTIKEVPDEAIRKNSEQTREVEAERILKILESNTYLVVLDPAGRELSSLEFAAWLGEREMSGMSVTMVIGGATGLAENIKEKANDILSFSRLTFPHQLFRLLLLEQLYRGFKILRGEPYHF